MSYYKTADNNYSTCKFIVDPVAGQGSHQTITAALASASSGESILIRAGTYTENLTLKAGVALVGYGSRNAVIVGKCSATFTGSCVISGLSLQTNSDYALSVTGSNATIITINNCVITGSNNDAIEFTSSSSSAAIQMNYCNLPITNTYKAWAMTSAGQLGLFCSSIGGTSTASTNSAGLINAFYTSFSMPMSCSSTGAFNLVQNIHNCSSINTTCVTTAGTGSSSSKFCNFGSGTASAVSIGSGTTYTSSNDSINSSNTNAVTGAGTFVFNALKMTGSSTAINPTTQTSLPMIFAKGSSGGTVSNNALSAYEVGSWTPALLFGGSATGFVYSTQKGYYTKIGQLVNIQCDITLSTKGSGTGAVTMSGLPYTSISSATSGSSLIPVSQINSLTLTAGQVGSFQVNSAATTLSMISYNPTSGSAQGVTTTNATFTDTTLIRFQGFYFTS